MTCPYIQICDRLGEVCLSASQTGCIDYRSYENMQGFERFKGRIRKQIIRDEHGHGWELPQESWRYVD